MAIGTQYIKRLIFKQIDNIYRYTQDSPVYPEVWLRYHIETNADPLRRVDLIFTPQKDSSAAELLRSLKDRLIELDPNRIYKQNTWELATTGEAVAAKLNFSELILAAIPLTKWWNDLRWPKESDSEEPAGWDQEKERQKNLDWFRDLVGAMMWIRDRKRFSQNSFDKAQSEGVFRSWYYEYFKKLEEQEGTEKPQASIWSVSMNRKASINLFQSVPATKADSSRMLFGIDGSKICWAILDTGIDATHPVFRKIKPGTKNEAYDQSYGVLRGKQVNYTRIKASYDFTKFRDIISRIAIKGDFDQLVAGKNAENDSSKVELNEHENNIYLALSRGRMLDWASIEPLLKISPDDVNNSRPKHPHGTHVAGILGANDYRENSKLTGMCPGIELYDIRVLDGQGVGEEFNILAAIQFVRWLNRQSDQIQIHGINLSLSLPHMVANFACGRTPICEACMRLISEGTVVVAAAGNKGQTMYRSEYGEEEQGFRTINITDPGNAETVITVGATHKSKPHTYGVSYFSSRGPTGDGRYKPDLVAPGEKVLSSVLNENFERMDGTSMAAPHVSGAAALVMAKHRELIGQPEKVKKILCESATDLGRERYFQGYGMLDVLRAIQSV